ncbi:MAG TPA: DUF2510 domain-containing protein [Acidimicrobiales bacterium]|nr:DUF2510 domain-containing protein [Acidimicrobiales bacterium]
MPHVSGSEAVVLVALAFLWAAVGYRLSENDRRTLGRTPWGLPSMVWALFWFLSLLLGLILYLFAHSSEVRRAQHNGSAVGTPGAAGPSSAVTRPYASRAPSVAEQFPAYPQPANRRPPEAGEASQQPAATPDQGSHRPERSESNAGRPPSPPAWHPDPGGRFDFRWWDGHQWTSHVSTDGRHLVDTNPDQRIGPY